MFQLSNAMQLAEEELLRLLQRLSEPCARRRLPAAVRPRYRRGLAELRGVQRDVRTVMDSLTIRAAQNQRKLIQHRERRQDVAQSVLAIVGTLVVVPTLVAALYADKVKFAGDATATDRDRMLLFMGAAVLLVFALVLGAMKLGQGGRRWRVRTVPATIAALTAAVVLALLGVVGP